MNMWIQTHLSLQFYSVKAMTSLSLILSLVLSGCSHFSSITPSDSSSKKVVAPKIFSQEGSLPQANVPVYANLDGQTLFEVMMAQLALDRGLYQDALYLFEQSALRTGDKQLLLLALELAYQLKRWALVEQLLSRLSGQTDVLEIGVIIGMQFYLHQGDHVSFASWLKRWQKLKNADYNLLNLAQHLPLDPGFLKEIAQQLQYFALQYKLPALLTIAGLSEQNRGEFAEAMRLVDAAIIASDNPLARLVKYQLLQQQGEDEEVAEFVLASYEAFPDHPAWALLRVQPVLDASDYVLAAQILKPAFRVNSKHERLTIVYAQVNLQLDYYDEASMALQQLLTSRQYQNEANYKLGFIAMQQGAISSAEHYFSQVGDSNYWQRARYFLIQLQWQQHQDQLKVIQYFDAMRIEQAQTSSVDKLVVDVHLLESNFWSEQALYSQAVQRLKKALQAYPKNSRLLYQYSLMADLNGQLQLASEILESLLVSSPQDADILNALGYTLLKQRQQLPRAKQLIEQSLRINPDNPAAMDSLGWFYFLDRRYELALLWLNKAYNELESDEVAAHLGEVYWMLGDYQQANTIWQQGLQYDADSPYILEVQQRLKK